jgi:probable HAF family extracellular repeat protein
MKAKANLFRTLLVLPVVVVVALFGLSLRTAETQTTPAPTTTYYDVQDLEDSASPASSEAYDINNSGQVVGSYFLETVPGTGWGTSHAVLYEDGQLQDLGTLDGTIYSVAYGINDSGKVVGYTGTSAADGGYRAFLYSDEGPMQPLGILGGFNTSQANDINVSGQIVGASSSQDGSGGVTSRAVRYEEDGTLHDLGALTVDGNSWAYGINDSGQVVGYSDTDSGFGAFLYDESANPKMQPLGAVVGGSWSWAHDINNSGQVVGFSDNGIWHEETGIIEWHAFLYENGEMQDLGTLDGHDFSEAYGINEAGQVVGHSLPQSDGGSDRAFLYENDQMTDLNTLIPETSGWTLHYAYSINSDGQIAAVGSKDGERHALLLNPTNTMPTPPDAPSIPDLDNASDSGVSNTDNLTNDVTPTFIGTADEGSKVKIYVDGVVKGSGTALGGSYSVTTSALELGEHKHNITATVSNNAGESQQSKIIPITIDTVTPVVTAIDPTDGATSVSRSTNVTATFRYEEKIDTGTLTGNVKLEKVGAGKRGSVTYTPVSAKVSYDTATRKVTLDPDSTLESGASYRVTIATGVKDAAGNAVTEGKVWSFKAGSK